MECINTHPMRLLTIGYTSSFPLMHSRKRVRIKPVMLHAWTSCYRMMAWNEVVRWMYCGGSRRSKPSRLLRIRMHHEMWKYNSVAVQGDCVSRCRTPQPSEALWSYGRSNINYTELARPASRLAGLRLMLMRYNQYSTSVAGAISNSDRFVNGCFHGEVTSLVLSITAVCTGASASDYQSW